MALPANVDTGLITGRFLVGVIDGPDEDSEPEGVPAQGTITFTASVPYLPNPTADPGPVTILKAPIVATLDPEGYLSTPDGARGVRLVATDDPDLSVQGWTWTVTYSFETVNGVRPQIASHSMALPGGSVIDLTTVVKVPSSTGIGTEQAEALAAAAQAAAAEAAQSAQEAASASAGTPASVHQYGAIGDGVADDTAAIQAAITAADGQKRVILEAGHTYRITGSLTNSQRPLDVDATGATLLIDDANASIQCTGTAPPIPASAVEKTTELNAPSGVATTNYTFTIADAIPSDWQEGDVIRWVAADMLPGSRDATPSGSGTAFRVGGFLTFLRYEDGKAVCTGRIDDPVTTNIRISRFDPTIKVRWSGGTIAYTDSAFDGATGYAFDMNILVRPVVENVDFPRVKSAAISVSTSVGWAVRNVQVGYGVNNLSLAAFGYGVANFGSVDGVLDSSRFTMVRHAYTNGSHARTEDNTFVSGHGRPEGNTISNCIGDSCTASPWDSHTQGRNETFINCTAINSPGGFTLRGFNHQIANAKVIGCRVGARIFSEGTGGESSGHVINGIFLDDAETLVEAEVNNTANHVKLNIRDMNASVVRGAATVRLRGRIARATNSTLRIEDSSFTLPPDGDAIRGALVANAGFSLRNCTLDMQSAGSSLSSLVSTAFNGNSAAVSEVDMAGVQIVNNDAAALDYLVSGGSGSSVTVRRADVTVDSPPAVSAFQYAYQRAGTQVSVD